MLHKDGCRDYRCSVLTHVPNALAFARFFLNILLSYPKRTPYLLSRSYKYVLSLLFFFLSGLLHGLCGTAGSVLQNPNMQEYLPLSSNS